MDDQSVRIMSIAELDALHQKRTALFQRAIREQQYHPDDRVPLAYVEVVYEAYCFAKPLVDRDTALRHARDMLGLFVMALNDHSFDGAMTLVKELCRTFDEAWAEGRV